MYGKEPNKQVCSVSRKTGRAALPRWANREQSTKISENILSYQAVQPTLVGLFHTITTPFITITSTSNLLGVVVLVDVICAAFNIAMHNTKCVAINLTLPRYVHRALNTAQLNIRLLGK